MTRDFSKIDLYLNELLGDIYAQPVSPDDLHIQWRQWIFDNWILNLDGVKNCLDVGCGQGISKVMTEARGISWTGVTLGTDYLYCKEQGWDVYKYDFSFLPDDWDEKFDLITAFHSLEHSAMPLLTLMEWHRVSKQFLCVVLPNPKHFTVDGLNHYSVMYDEQFRRLCKRAGWNVIWDNVTDFELRYMCQKVKPIKE